MGAHTNFPRKGPGLWTCDRAPSGQRVRGKASKPIALGMPELEPANFLAMNHNILRAIYLTVDCN